MAPHLADLAALHCRHREGPNTLLTRNMTFVMEKDLDSTTAFAPGPRERMVHSAVELLGRGGLSGTGLRQIIEHAGAPRGSLQHYFPHGKDQLAAESLALAGRAAAKHLARLQDRGQPLAPSGVLVAMVESWRRRLQASDYAHGCPVVAAAADSAAASEVVRTAADSAFRTWQTAIEVALERAGVPAGRRTALALLMLSALEGAIALARTRRDIEPLEVVLTELAPVLDAAVK